jgi:hypothetical protein
MNAELTEAGGAEFFLLVNALFCCSNVEREMNAEFTEAQGRRVFIFKR